MKTFDAEMKAANPVRRMRERHGYTRADFARATGCPYPTILRAENGLTSSLPRAILEAAADVGEDAAALAGEYAEWAVRLRAAYAKKSAPDATR